MTEQHALFDLPADARVPRRSRAGRSVRPRAHANVTNVAMPEPVLPARPGPRGDEGPCLAGMEEVGTGLLDHVDAMQRVAASAPPGPLLINAAPGTGKTHVLVRRIAYHIVELRIPASQCLVLVPEDEAVSLVSQALTELIRERAAEVTVLSFAQARSVPPLGHVFVDDMHRMPLALYESLRSDRSGQAAMTVTADPDSLIRGEPTAVERFPKDFTDVQAVRLSRNYRNTPPMIALASQLVAGVSRVPGRGMLPNRPACGVASLGRYFAVDASDEYAFAARLPDVLQEHGIAPSEIAMLRPDDYPELSGVDSLALSEVGGRQFRVVCLLGVTAESFPDEPAARRGLYTAATRAEDLLYLSHAGEPSPLLSEVDQGLFSAFGQVEVRSPRVEQPRLI